MYIYAYNICRLKAGETRVVETGIACLYMRKFLEFPPLLFSHTQPRNLVRIHKKYPLAFTYMYYHDSLAALRMFY